MSSIGVFDSGHGGLTVLRALVDAAPGRPYTFLGDHAHAPYGRRDFSDIDALTRNGVSALFNAGCRLVIIACNTAAAVSLRRLQQTWLADHWPQHNVLGVLVPMVEAITRVPWIVDTPPPEQPAEPRTVGIFATPATVASNSFAREIGKRAPDVRVVQQACPDLVPAIEAGAGPETVTPLVKAYVNALMDQVGPGGLDAVVLGCTHYPLVAFAFRAALPPTVEIFDQPRLVTRSFDHYLTRHPEYGVPLTATPAPVRFLTTGQPEVVGPLASRFFGAPTPFDQVRF